MKTEILCLRNLVDQVSSRNLAEVCDSSAEQGEVGVLQVGQVKGEGNLALKPGLYRVPVGRNNVYRVGTARVETCRSASSL